MALIGKTTAQVQPENTLTQAQSKSSINFKGMKTSIFGIQGSGKTQWILKQYKRAGFKRPVIFQINDDDPFIKEKDILVWKVDRNIIQKKINMGLSPEEALQTEINLFCVKVWQWAQEGKIDLIIFDEADLFFRGNFDLNFYIQDLVLNHRHFNKLDPKGVAMWFATRRPQDIPTKVVESCKYLIIYKLEGANAIQRFREIHPQLPAYIEALDKNKFQFVFKEIGEKPFIHKKLN